MANSVPPAVVAGGAPLAASAPAAIGASEKLCIGALFLLLLVLKVICARHYRIDSDEPQHLHVVWGWANGMLQYRDIFDNHSPLFQMLCAPLFRLFGERADVVIPMRYAMLPLFAFDLWCVYAIARHVGTQRLAVWTALAVGLSPVFFLVSTEFRTDDLWVACWLLTLVLVTGGPFRGWRAFWSGLVMGVAFAVSMKSSILLGSLLLCGAMIFFLRRKFADGNDTADILRGLGLALLGLVIVPGILIGYFAYKGALQEMYYGIIVHNTVLGGNKLRKFAFKRFLFPIGLIVCPYLGYWLVRLRSDRRAAYTQALIISTGLLYAAALKSFWPLITDQDYLPRDPLFIVGLAPAVAWLARFKAPRTYAVTGLILLGELIALCNEARPWRNDAADKIGEIAEVLRLTNPNDYVMDGKGEFIYRRRPFFYVLEGISIARMKQNLIRDDIPQKLVETHTCVLLRGRLPKGDEGWIHDNYLFDVEKIGVAGKQLPEGNGPIAFSIAIPASYTVMVEKGAAAGTLDGKPLSASQFLAAGAHRLELAGPRGSHGRIAVLWAQAIERGYVVHWRID